MANKKNVNPKVEVSPKRVAPRSYHGARPGYSVDEVLGNRVFHPGDHPDEKVMDTDDERNTEKLFKSGVDEPFDDQDHTNEKDEDREYALAQQAYLSHARHEHLAEEQGLDAEEDISEDEIEAEAAADRVDHETLV